MRGRTAGCCLAHTLELEEKNRSFKFMLSPYAQTFTGAALVEVIVLDAKPDSCIYERMKELSSII